MLNRAAILIVEDEPFIALGLALAIQHADGEVVGPAASVKAALMLLETHGVVGAILDVNLTDGVISPVVDYLMQRQIPLIIQTGVGIPPDLAARFPDLIVRIKPTISDQMIAELAELIVERQVITNRALKDPDHLIG